MAHHVKTSMNALSDHTIAVRTLIASTLWEVTLASATKGMTATEPSAKLPTNALLACTIAIKTQTAFPWDSFLSANVVRDTRGTVGCAKISMSALMIATEVVLIMLFAQILMEASTALVKRDTQEMDSSNAKILTSVLMTV